MFKCYLPNIQSGFGILSQLGELAKSFGKKAIVTIDPFLDKNGTADEILAILGKAGIDAIKYTDIQPNPNCFKVDEAGAIAREHGSEMVVAVGGGSSMDFGKGVAVVARYPGKAWEYTSRSDHEVRQPGKDILPIITIPTTAGTGSEATPFAVFNNPEIHEKSSLINDIIFPDMVLVDPELMMSMPPRVTASTGFDAFSHSLESYISLNANHFTRMVARDAITIVARYLPEAVANGENRTARENMAWASTMGGSAIAQIGVALPHGLGQPVGGLTGMPHGECLAACMVQILRRSYLADIQSFAEIAEMMDPSVRGLTMKQKAERCPELVAQLLDDINLHVTFSDYGMTENDIDKVTNNALTGYLCDVVAHPKKVTEEEIHAIYRECL